MKRAVEFTAVSFFIAAAVFAVWSYVSSGKEAGIDAFVAEYTATRDVAVQERIAAKYLSTLSAQDLNEAIERKYPLSECHVQGHGIGRAVYAQMGNLTESIRQCGNACNSGCFHGVIMGMFSSRSDTFGGAVSDDEPDAYLRRVTELAKSICESPDVRGLVMPIVCMHGMGHVFSLYADVDTAVDRCRVFRTASGTATCAGGVFMEYGKNPDNFQTLTDQGFPFCDRFPQFGTHCYRYIAVVMAKKYGGSREAMLACLELPGQKRFDCIFGIAFYALELRDFKESDGPDRICGVLHDPDYYRQCVDGGLWDIANRTGDTEGDPVCDALDPIFRDRCHAHIVEQQHAF